MKTIMTHHANDRADTRVITPDQIQQTTDNPECTYENHRLDGSTIYCTSFDDEWLCVSAHDTKNGRVVRTAFWATNERSLELIDAAFDAGGHLSMADRQKFGLKW